jgi:hypothetical protein
MIMVAVPMPAPTPHKLLTSTDAGTTAAVSEQQTRKASA